MEAIKQYFQLGFLIWLRKVEVTWKSMGETWCVVIQMKAIE